MSLFAAVDVPRSVIFQFLHFPAIVILWSVIWQKVQELGLAFATATYNISEPTTANSNMTAKTEIIISLELRQIA